VKIDEKTARERSQYRSGFGDRFFIDLGSIWGGFGEAKPTKKRSKKTSKKTTSKKKGPRGAKRPHWTSPRPATGPILVAREGEGGGYTLPLGSCFRGKWGKERDGGKMGRVKPPVARGLVGFLGY